MDHRTAARNEALAALILSHLASNTAVTSRRGSSLGRNSTRVRGRSVSFSNCACAGPTCTSRPQQPGNTLLDTGAAHAWTLPPAGGQRGRHWLHFCTPPVPHLGYLGYIYDKYPILGYVFQCKCSITFFYTQMMSIDVHPFHHPAYNSSIIQFSSPIFR